MRVLVDQTLIPCLPVCLLQDHLYADVTLPPGCRRERSRAVTAVFGGLDVGSAVGLVLCGPIIHHFGWPAVFYLFAVMGVLWCVLLPQLKPDEPDLLVPSELQPADKGTGEGAVRALLSFWSSIAEYVQTFLQQCCT